MTPSALIVAVIVAGPPEVAVAFNVISPLAETVQKLFVGVEYVIYDAGKLLVKNPAMLYVPVSVIFLLDVGVLALSVAVIIESFVTKSPVMKDTVVPWYALGPESNAFPEVSFSFQYPIIPVMSLDGRRRR
jgi:hypothetical protein